MKLASNNVTLELENQRIAAILDSKMSQSSGENVMRGLGR